jgi:hypothetical protein
MRRKLNNVPYIADRTDPEEVSDSKLIKSPFSSMRTELVDKIISIRREKENICLL